MNRWGRRIRAAAGMGLTWGAAAFVAGILLARVPGFSSDLPFAFLFAPLGFVTGIIFSGILVAVESRRGNDRVSLSRFATWGAASGLLLSGIFAAAAAVRGASWWGELLTFGPALTIASAACAAGSLGIARRAERRELRSASAVPIEAELTDHDERELLGRASIRTTTKSTGTRATTCDGSQELD
jgi:hypothetical protein